MKSSIWAAPFQKNALSAAVCLGLIAMVPAAQATILTASATVELQSSAPLTDMATGPSSVSVYSNGADSTGYAYGAAWGNDSGDMFSRASGNGFFSAESHIQQAVEFTNDSGTAQSYSFDFTINSGSLWAQNYATFGAGEYVQAGNAVAIKLNGVNVFTSDATLLNSEGGINLSTNGVALGSYVAGSNNYGWGTYTGTLDLGIFNAGDTFLLEYDIFTFTDSNVATLSNCEDGYGGWGEEIGGDNEISCWFNSDGSSRFGDPNGINGMPITSHTVTGTPASVPEPGLLFLLGGGVAGLAFARRNRARKG
ncbi:MAG: PEP-CTERM sorting domain-containing protein [Gammaproteobacteria bacterium]|nr:PEP-CTERM sorting domain-containing protein [Gammaproteobacteria bacterium]MCF6230451.1 PEP-CTERM sorting domain-containing protein [Gammaproteobacteria bacterium]